MEKYLKLISDHSYQEYLDARNDGIVLFEKEYKSGFVYVKDNKDSYGIRISFTSNEVETLYEDIKDYLTYKKVYLLINGRNSEVIEHYSSMKLMYSVFELTNDLSDYKYEDTNLNLKEYEESMFDEFVDVLGHAFVPVREAANLKPYNWYANNLEEARTGFLEAKKHGFWGHFENDELIGVIGIERNTVDMLAVKRSHQGKGLGSRLLKESVNKLVQKGEKYVVLSVLAKNDSAIDFYIRHGFEVTGNLCILESE